MADTATARLVERFCAGALADDEWTHEAHLAVCHVLLRQASGDQERVVILLRRLITVHNDRAGVPPERGYHETITRYFVGAVAASAAEDLAGLAADPACQRDAPHRHWSAPVVRGADARAGWVPPDLAPLPWPAPDVADPPVGAASGGSS